MPLPDIINGIFESAGGFFIALSVLKLHREKLVRGVSWMHVTFFTSWGIWNLYFYPHLDQWFSFFGGLLLVLINLVWLGQIVFYVAAEEKAKVIEAIFNKAVHERAKKIYDAYAYNGYSPKPPYTTWGNSLKMEEARDDARRELKKELTGQS